MVHISYNPHTYIIYQVPYHQSPLVMSTTLLQVKVSKYFLALFSTAVSLLAIRIFTGRQHQIRAHLAHVGHPVLTDGAFGRKFLRCGENRRKGLGLNGRRVSQICSRVWNIEFTIPLESLDHFGAYQSISCHMSVFSMVSHGKIDHKWG